MSKFKRYAILICLAVLMGIFFHNIPIVQASTTVDCPNYHIWSPSGNQKFSVIDPSGSQHIFLDNPSSINMNGSTYLTGSYSQTRTDNGNWNFISFRVLDNGNTICAYWYFYDSSNNNIWTRCNLYEFVYQFNGSTYSMVGSPTSFGKFHDIYTNNEYPSAYGIIVIPSVYNWYAKPYVFRSNTTGLSAGTSTDTSYSKTGVYITNEGRVIITTNDPNNHKGYEYYKDFDLTTLDTAIGNNYIYDYNISPQVYYYEVDGQSVKWYYSTNGTIYYPQTFNDALEHKFANFSTAANIAGVVYFKSYYYLSHGGYIYRSQDLLNWSVVYTPSLYTTPGDKAIWVTQNYIMIQGVECPEAVFISGHYESNGDGEDWVSDHWEYPLKNMTKYSEDGVNWIYNSSDYYNTYASETYYGQIAEYGYYTTEYYVDGKYINIMYNKGSNIYSVCTSTDGINWSAVTSLVGPTVLSNTTVKYYNGWFYYYTSYDNYSDDGTYNYTTYTYYKTTLTSYAASTESEYNSIPSQSANDSNGNSPYINDNNTYSKVVNNYIYKVGGTTSGLTGTRVLGITGTQIEYKGRTLWLQGYNHHPVSTVINPVESQVLGNSSSFIPSIQVSDVNGDVLTCKCYIDGSSVASDIRTISNTKTTQIVSFNAIDTSSLSDGEHTVTFELSEALYGTITQNATFKIDRNGPNFTSVTFNNSENTIGVNVTAIDSASGLDGMPYRYTVGGVQSQWTADSSYTVGPLMPNTQYAVKVEAKDKVGNVSSKEQAVYTQAQVPYVSASAPTENSLNLAFSDINPGNTKYQIMFGNMYVTENGTLNSTPVWFQTSGKTMTVTGLPQNTSYKIKAKALNNDNVETAFSSEITGTTLASPPAKVTFTPAQTTMTIGWEAVPNAVSYNIEKDGVAERNITGTSYTHTGLTPETSHSYRISVNTTAGTGNWSNIYTKSTYPYPPVTPGNFTITGISQKYISLSWDTVVKASEYILEVNGTELGSYTTTTAVIENLTPNTQYKFRIKARNAGGDSAWSDYLTETTWPVIPEIPSNVTVRKTNISVDVWWNSSERADGYEIEADGLIIDVGNEFEYLHEGLTALSAHTYRVRAYNRGGKSEWSQLINVTTNPDKPSMPNNIMATSDKNYTTLIWYLVPYAEKYDIEIDSKDMVTVTDLSARINGLQPGTTHTYRVSARNVTGSSDWSDYVTVSTLAESDQAMTSLTNVIAVVTNSYITISWDDVDTNAEYVIEVDGVLQDIGKDRVYNHTRLSANQYHTYKVKAKTTASQEYWCAVLSLSTLPDPPGAPEGVEATAYDNQIEIKWNKSDNVTYDIEIDGQTIDNGENNTYIDPNLNPGTEHTYRVRAKNAMGVTAWSAAITKSTTLPEYTVECAKDNTFDFSVLASNVQDFTGLQFVITFDESDLDIEDLCSFTQEKDTKDGAISGTKLNISRDAGKIIIKVKDNIVHGTSWSGELDNIIFKSKIDGETKISVTVENK